MTKVGIYSATALEFFGGGERFALLLADYLTSHGLDVAVVSSERPNEFNRIHTQSLEPQLSDQYRKEPFLGGGFKMLGRDVAQPMPTFDSMRGNDTNFVLVYRFPDPIYMRRAGKLGIHLIFLLHGVTLETLPHPDPIVLLYQCYLRLQIARAARIVNRYQIRFQVFTTEMADGLVRLGVSRRQINVVPLKIDASKFTVKRADEIFNVLFIGRLENIHKGISRLARVARQLLLIDSNDLSLTVVGSGSAQAVIRRLQGRLPRLFCTGYVTEQEKRTLLADANLMLITSNLEPYPTTVLEGLASGLPVVSTPASGPTAILRKSDRFGRLCSFRSADLVWAIERYYRQWKSEKSHYFEEKVSRRREAISMLDLSDDPYQQYLKMARWEA